MTWGLKFLKAVFVIVQDRLSVKRHCSLPHNSKLTYGFMEGQQNVNSSLSIESQSIIDVVVNKWWEISMRALHLYGNLKEASAVSLTPRSKTKKTSCQRNTEWAVKEKSNTTNLRPDRHQMNEWPHALSKQTATRMLLMDAIEMNTFSKCKAFVISHRWFTSLWPA